MTLDGRVRLQLGSRPLTGSLLEPAIADGNKDRVFGRNKSDAPGARGTFAEDNTAQSGGI